MNSSFRAGLSAWRFVAWRGGAALGVLLCAWIALGAGVGVSERDLAGTGVAVHVYYVLGLFVLGGLDLGTPIGGPRYARVLLWIAYFGAPLITASALIEAAVHLISPLAVRARPWRDHVVLGGAGQLTLLYVDRLRAIHPRRTIVVVERDAGRPSIAELRNVYRAIVIVGDVTRDTVLKRLRLDRCRRAMFLTGDDFVNLDSAAKVLRLAPNLSGRIGAHVSDLGLMRETARSRMARECEIFNAHKSAAVSLVQDHLLSRFHSTVGPDVVVIAGFGRFGQTVLHQLQEHANGSFSDVLIVDTNATRNARAFAEYPGFSDDYRHTILDGDMLDPEVWRTVGRTVEETGQEPVVVMGSGSDGTNLRAALSVRKRHPDAYLIVRSFRASPFTEEIAHDARLHAFNLGSLVRDGMPESWF